MMITLVSCEETAKTDNCRGRVTHYIKHFTENSQGDIQVPMEIKDITSFEQLKVPNINVFELS